MESACTNPDCTVVETGICLLNNPVSDCPNRTTASTTTSVLELISELAPPLESPSPNPRFPLSLSLGPAEASTLMCGRYCHVIGILGAPNAGKTASLVSLYLLLSHGKLEGFEFADSRSIMAFEEISRGARRWNQGNPPEEMTSHTELADERNAGFLHLRLLHKVSGRRTDLLLPDLPGEWSTALIENNRVDRLGFLQSADCIWLMVDGQHLTNPATRKNALHRTSLLIQRLSQYLVEKKPPLTLVITRRDLGSPPNEVVEKLKHEAKRNGFFLQVQEIASFAEAGGALPGAGIAELVESVIVADNVNTQTFWADSDITNNSRAILKFRK